MPALSFWPASTTLFIMKIVTFCLSFSSISSCPGGAHRSRAPSLLLSLELPLLFCFCDQELARELALEAVFVRASYNTLHMPQAIRRR